MDNYIYYNVIVMNYLFLKEGIKEYFGIFILLFIISSFYIYTNTNVFSINKEGICVSKPFSLNRAKSAASDKYGENNKASASVVATIDGFVSVMDLMKADMDMLKKLIPLNFSLGVVNNIDGPSTLKMSGNVPRIFVNFDIQNPPEGPTGMNGLNAPPYGETGFAGMIGPAGEPGYWGTTKDTLF